MRAMVTRLLLVLMLGACGVLAGGPTGFSEEGFSIRVRDRALVLGNATAADIHYVALEEETSTRVDLYFEPRQWPRLAPGEEKRIPFEELSGYGPGARQARVYWWTEADQRYRHAVIDLR